MRNKIDTAKTAEHLMNIVTAEAKDAEAEQEIIDQVNSKNFKAALKETGILSRMNINRAYMQARYGKYALAATVFAAAAVYTTALLAAPTLIPFGLAAITTVWLKWTLAAVFGATAAYTGFLFLKSSTNEFMALMTRLMNTFKKNEDLKNDDRTLSNSDVALLATITLGTGGLVALLYAMPSLLPAALSSMSAAPKLATTITSGVVAVVTGVASIKGFFANRSAAAEADRTAAAEEKELRDKGEDPVANPYLKFSI